MLEKVKSLYKVVLFCITLFFSPLVSACISGIEAVEANITLAITMASTMVEFILYYRAPQSATNDKKFRRRQANSWLMNLKIDLSNSFSVEAIDQLNLPLIFMMKRVRNAFERVGIVGSNPRYVVMMAMPNPNAHVEATQYLPEDHGDCVGRMKFIRLKLTGNIYITTLPADLTALDVLIANYDGAHGAARAVALQLVKDALTLIMRKYQDFANLPINKLNSIVIIESGGWHVRGIGGNHAVLFDCANGIASGEVMLCAPGGPDRSLHVWWYSADQITWTMLYPTIKAHTSQFGLIPGHYAWFRHEMAVSTGGTGVSQDIKIMVK